ncbi:myb-related protein MYBAS2 isoform X1 [Dendrobium catenatum]|uniref:Myb-related protein MYBAS1 n=1 Tax=Dendrobium catenatum TaxID=906689 RepID=A0A2I0X937_9ASPA|nr:myb-related protein MYBAS2 isoform X1 [Dendrobium catenatum]PKU84438.1 Myb-related protein MYBAS1 [Dendrobium catenatum]
MVVVSEEIRKGPWTEQEDLQLVCFVSLFGERRWDFIAKVSGLNRTGKSCRLRWFNYLQPGLKHGRMTPQEERLILELHSEWGNRWSRIARRLPGRTDNEIKNYWRTHMRKKAQERKKNSSSSASTISTCLSTHSASPLDATTTKNEEDGSSLITEKESREKEYAVNVYPMEQIWNDIASLESGGSSFAQCTVERCNLSCDPPPMTSPVQEHFVDYLWMMDDNEFSKIATSNDFRFLTSGIIES